MAITIKNIIPRKQAENTQSGQYTAVNCKCIIDKFTATNTSVANASLSVNLIISGGSAGDGNLVVKERMLAPKETYTFPELAGQVLENGGFISTIASALSSVTISASGREIT